MVATRGLYLTPDRYFLILLVPALALGVARRYVLDFLPFIALIILYEVTRGVAHILRPHPYYAPQLDIDRWLTRNRTHDLAAESAVGRPPVVVGGRALGAHQAPLHRAADAALPDLAAPPRPVLPLRGDDASPSASRARSRSRSGPRRRPGWRGATAGSRSVHRIDYTSVTGVPDSTVVVDPPALRHPQRLGRRAVAARRLRAAGRAVLLRARPPRRARIDPVRAGHVVRDRVLRRALRVGRADRLRATPRSATCSSAAGGRARRWRGRIPPPLARARGAPSAVTAAQNSLEFRAMAEQRIATRTDAGAAQERRGALADISVRCPLCGADDYHVRFSSSLGGDDRSAAPLHVDLARSTAAGRARSSSAAAARSCT